MTTDDSLATSHERIGAQSVRHHRIFLAPAERVQRAHTDPDLFTRWMGPRGSTVRIERFDAVTGGAFDYTVQIGGDHVFRGSYHLVEPGRIVHTWQYVGETEITLEDLNFRDIDAGRSELEVFSTYGSEAACTAMIESGLDAGMDSDFIRIDELLATLT